MTTIDLDGHTYNVSDLITAIQESNDAANQTSIEQLEATLVARDASVTALTARVAELENTAIGSTESGNLLQALLTRLAAIESMLPLTRAGFGVTTTVSDGVTTYRVQTLDQNGNTQIITFELPITSSN
jgi:hypothetical protein